MWSRALPVVLGCALVGVLGHPIQGVSQPVFEAIGGTWNNPPDGPSWSGMAILAFYRDESTRVVQPLLLRGPDGWNNGSPSRLGLIREQAGAAWSWALLSDLPPAAGSYILTAALADGRQVNASFSIRDPSRLLERPSIRVTSASPRGVSVEWTRTPGALSYRVHIVDPRARRIVDRPHATTSTSHSFALSLFPGTYRVNIFAFPIDITSHAPAVPEQFNCSENGVVFNVQQ